MPHAPPTAGRRGSARRAGHRRISILVGNGALYYPLELARSVAAPERLVRRYGTEAPAVAALADGRPELLEPVAPGVPVCAAELLWATRHELALTTDDLVDRRTRAGLVPEWRAEAVAAAGGTGIDSLRAPWALRLPPPPARAAPPSLR